MFTEVLNNHQDLETASSVKNQEVDKAIVAGTHYGFYATLKKMKHFAICYHLDETRRCQA